MNLVRTIRVDKRLNVKVIRKLSNNKQTDHIKALEGMIGAGNVLTSDITKYTTDWTHQYKGGSIVLTPNSTNQISTIMKYCHQEKLSVVPQGGNTGLVGGQVGYDNEIILSLHKLNHILEIDDISGIAIVEGGVILEELMNQSALKKWMVPYDLGSKGTCQIGGNISTNAGGLRYLKYGSMHNNLLGLEIVTADGTVIDMLRTLPKDNSGYHLKNLFIGSEGTLGIITKAAIQLRPTPTSQQVALLILSSFEKVIQCMQQTQRQLYDILSALEYMDRPSLSILQSTYPQLLSKLNSDEFKGVNETANSTSSGHVYMLLECSGYAESTDIERFQTFLGNMFESEVIVDAIIAQDHTQLKNLWSIREHVPVGLMHASRLINPLIHQPGRLYKYDISVSVTQWTSLIEKIKYYLYCGYNFHIYAYDSDDLIHNADSIATQSSTTTCYNTLSMTIEESDLLSKLSYLCHFHVCNFGHIGDQNLHINILMTWRHSEDIISNMISSISETDINLYKELIKRILDHVVYYQVIQSHGSVSAEHGIGQQKLHWLQESKSKEEIQMMIQIKKALDPNNILNPGKVLSKDLLR